MAQLPEFPPEGTQNKGPAIIAIFLLTARLYVQARILKKLWLDDLFISISVVRIDLSKRTESLSLTKKVYTSLPSSPSPSYSSPPMQTSIDNWRT